MKTALIIGGGFAGCASAHQLALQGGWDVTLVDSAPVLGGGCKTLWMGGHPYTFGPRHFLTQNVEVFEYLDKYCPLRRCQDHQFVTYIHQDAQFYSYPIHVDDLDRMPESDRIDAELADCRRLQGAGLAKNLEEFWIASVGRTLYDKFVNAYSKKMWLVDDNRDIDDFGWSPKGVTLKEGPREAWDTAFSAYPYAKNGYDDYFDIATRDAHVRLRTRIDAYDIPNKTVWIDGEKHDYDIIINTISPDLILDQAYGALPYIGRDFIPLVLPCEAAFPDNVYFVYYAGGEIQTRVVEYKKFTHHTAPTTLIGIEIPSRNGRYYPVPFKSEMARAQKYFDAMPDGVFSIGRAGSYLYRIDADDCIEQAMDIGKALQG